MTEINVQILPIGVAASENCDGIKHTYALRASGQGWVYKSHSGPKALWCPIDDAADVPPRFREAIAEYRLDATRKALKTAVDHIEHMAAWIAKQNTGYSFESLGEDMPAIKAELAR